jgi:hypothetical protein
VIVEIKNLKISDKDQWEKLNMLEKTISKAMGVVTVQAFVFICGLILFILNKVL